MTNSDRASGTLLLAVAAVGAWHARGFSDLGGVFVWWVLGILALFGLLLVVKGRLRPDLRRVWRDQRAPVAVALLLASLIAYVALLPRFGFIAASSLFAGAVAVALLGERRSRRLSIVASLVGVAVSVALYAVFHYGFTVPLPVGSLWGGS